MHLKQKHPHLQVVLSIGGPLATEIFPIVAGNPLYRVNFARSALGLVEASGLDGIDSESLSKTFKGVHQKVSDEADSADILSSRMGVPEQCSARH